jgi:hypothetical protein
MAVDEVLDASVVGDWVVKDSMMVEESVVGGESVVMGGNWAADVMSAEKVNVFNMYDIISGVSNTLTVILLATEHWYSVYIMTKVGRSGAS